MTETYKKILQLTETTAPDDDFTLMGVANPGGTPADRRLELGNAVRPYLYTGWILAAETWTYASASTVTISGDYTGRYAMGQVARLKQGGGYKYFWIASAVYGAPNTTLGLAPVNGSDTVANQGITDTYYAMHQPPIDNYASGSSACLVPYDGTWERFLPTLTYYDTTQFTIAGDYTRIFRPGTKMAVYVSSAWKYFYIATSSYASSTTTVTRVLNADYTWASSSPTITVVYNGAAEPIGFPGWFNFTATPTGYSAAPTGIYRYKLNGKIMSAYYKETANGTSNATTKTYLLPYSASTTANVNLWGWNLNAYDNGVATYNNTWKIEAGSPTIVTCYKGNGPGTTWTGSGNCRVWDNGAGLGGTLIQYEIL